MLKKLEVGWWEVPCDLCNEPLLIGPDDLFHLQLDGRNEPQAAFCARCYQHARPENVDLVKYGR
jgi:hypothetical protein